MGVSVHRIVRHYQRGKKRVLKNGVSLEEAEAHCHSSESSWKTATRCEAHVRTERKGPWFDDYEEAK